MNIERSYPLLIAALLLAALSSAWGLGCAQPTSEDFVIESSIKTEKIDKFKLGTIFIDTRTASGAFVVLKEVTDGVPGEVVMASKLPLGRREVLTVTLDGDYKLKPGKQKLQVSVHIDENKNGALDDSDPLAQSGGAPMQKIIEVEVTSTSTLSYAAFAEKIHTILPKELEIGTIFLGTTLEDRYYLVTRLVEDGKPGKALGVNELRFKGKEHKYKATLEHQLMQQTQKIHLAVYRVTGGKAWKLDTWDENAPIVVDKDGKELAATVEVTFESSVSDPKSPFYAYTCGIQSPKYIEHKTKLLVDCRCTQNRIRKPTFAYCNGNAHTQSGFVRGDGPQFAPTKGHQTSGDVFPDRDEIVFGIDRGGVNDPNGGLRRRFLIAALNYKTNTRRYVSGEAVDPAQGEFVKGDGPLGQEVSMLRRGPDGKAYLYSNGDGGWIMRVDLDSGDREVIWKHGEDGYGQCPNGVKPEGDPDWKLGDSKPAPYQMGIEGRGFTIGPDGSFYLPTTANGVPRPGYAIIRVSKDGKSCKVVSTSGAEKRNEYFGGIGKGFDIKGPVGAMTWHEGKILAITWGGDLLEVDPDSGDRRRIAGGTINGSSSLPVSYRIFVDPDTRLLMLTGFLPPNNSGLGGVDLKTGKFWTFLCLNVDPDNPYTSGCIRGPQETKHIAYWPGYRLPDGTYLGGFALRGFTRYEISTGNSYLFSY